MCKPLPAVHCEDPPPTPQQWKCAEARDSSPGRSQAAPLRKCPQSWILAFTEAPAKQRKRDIREAFLEVRAFAPRLIIPETYSG